MNLAHRAYGFVRGLGDTDFKLRLSDGSPVSDSADAPAVVYGPPAPGTPAYNALQPAPTEAASGWPLVLILAAVAGIAAFGSSR